MVEGCHYCAAATGLVRLLKKLAQLRSVALGKQAASRAGISPGAMEVAALAIAGGTAGLAGGILVLSTPFVLQDGFSSGYGFQGLVVGLLARGSAPGVALAALLFGFLGTGGISHWPATPDSGKINEAWDREFLRRWEANDKAGLLSYSDEETYRDAGQGGFEIRTFIAVAAAAKPGVSKVERRSWPRTGRVNLETAGCGARHAVHPVRPAPGSRCWRR